MSDDVWRLIDGERTDLADFLDSLSVTDWEHHSLCEGWSVRDVVGHLLWVPTVTLSSVLPDLIAARLNLDRAIDRNARERGRRSPDDLRADFRRLVGDRRLPIRTAATGVLADTIVHHQDIRRALMRERVVPAERISVALAAYAPTFGKRIRGLELHATDVPFTYGTGPVVTGTGEQLLMCITGRMQVVAEVGGPGKAALAGRS